MAIKTQASVFSFEKQWREMKQHFNPENSRTAAASAPLEKLMCWKETRSKKGKGQKEKGKGVAGEKKAQNRH